MRRFVATVLALVAFAVSGCSREADLASENLSTAADQFEGVVWR